jgi:hypothetical protein
VWGQNPEGGYFGSRKRDNFCAILFTVKSIKRYNLGEKGILIFSSS